MTRETGTGALLRKTRMRAMYSMTGKLSKTKEGKLMS